MKKVLNTHTMVFHFIFTTPIFSRHADVVLFLKTRTFSIFTTSCGFKFSALSFCPMAFGMFWFFISSLENQKVKGHLISGTSDPVYFYQPMGPVFYFWSSHFYDWTFVQSLFFYPPSIPSFNSKYNARGVWSISCLFLLRQDVWSFHWERHQKSPRLFEG